MARGSVSGPMRSLSVIAVFLVACGHPGAVHPTVPSRPAQPIPAPEPKRVAQACVPETDPAAEVLQALRTQLLTLVEKDSPTLQESIPAHVSAFRIRNKAVLTKHAAWSFLRLPKATVPDLDTLPDDSRVTPAVASRIQEIVGMEKESGGPLFQVVLGLLSDDPIRTFAGIRGLVRFATGSPSDLDRVREDILEGLAPPLLTRVNDDTDHPILAMQKRADVFVVWLDRDDRLGAFLPRRIRWVRRIPPAAPVPIIKTADDALRSFAVAVEETLGVPGDGDTVANLSMRLLAKVQSVGEKWLAPHASLLLENAACEGAKVPRKPLPDFAGWKEDEGVWRATGMTALFPRLRWSPLQAFLFLRTTVASPSMAAGDYAALSLVDSLAPPTIARANDERENPVLFLVEGDTALVVAFSSVTDRGFFPTDVRILRRGGKEKKQSGQN
jgi:hypothetical protein